MLSPGAIARRAPNPWDATAVGHGVDPDPQQWSSGRGPWTATTVRSCQLRNSNAGRAPAAPLRHIVGAPPLGASSPMMAPSRHLPLRKITRSLRPCPEGCPVVRDDEVARRFCWLAAAPPACRRCSARSTATSLLDGHIPCGSVTAVLTPALPPPTARRRPPREPRSRQRRSGRCSSSSAGRAELCRRWHGQRRSASRR